jgi:hypothetical protein
VATGVVGPAVLGPAVLEAGAPVPGVLLVGVPVLEVPAAGVWALAWPGNTWLTYRASPATTATVAAATPLVIRPTRARLTSRARWRETSCVRRDEAGV